MDESLNSFYDIDHGCFRFPIFVIQNWHADLASFVDVNVQEIFSEGDVGCFGGKFIWKGDLYWVEAALVERSLAAFDPDYPEVVSVETFVLTLDDFDVGLEREFLKFVL